jgi:hypothetical protein
MTRYANRWTALLAWAALMGIVWAIFVPRGLSVGTFTMLVLTGPLALLTGTAVWATHRPSAPLGDTGAPTTVAEAAASGRR